MIVTNVRTKKNISNCYECKGNKDISDSYTLGGIKYNNSSLSKDINHEKVILLYLSNNHINDLLMASILSLRCPIDHLY